MQHLWFVVFMLLVNISFWIGSFIEYRKGGQNEEVFYKKENTYDW